LELIRFLLCFIQNGSRNEIACGVNPHASERRIKQMFRTREKGQGFVEYALIFMLVAFFVIALLTLFGPWLNDAYSNVITNL
jgi:pilus assembly protein Flp/PilA